MIDVLNKKVKRQFKEKGFKELVFGSATTFVLRVLGMLAGALFTFIMAKLFGASTVGAFHLSQTVLLLFTILSKLGMDTAIVKLFSQNIVFNNWPKVLGIYNRVIATTIPLGIFWGVVLYFSSGLIATHIFNKPYLEDYLKIISIGILPMSLRFINSECYRGMRQLRLYAYSQNVSYFIYSLVVMSILYYVVKDQNKFVPNISFVIALGILAVTSSISVKSKIKEHVGKQEANPIQKREILKTSLPMMLSNSMMQISGWINTLFLGYYCTDADVGIYRVVLHVATVCAFILVSINSVAAPRFAQLYAKRDMLGLARAARQTSAVNFFASIPIFLIIVIFRERIMGYFGAEFAIGAQVLLFNMAGQFMNIFCGSVGSFLNMTGREKEFQNILLICTVINLISCMIFIPMYGLMGSAICTMLYMSSWNIISAIYIYKKYKIQTFYWPFAGRIKEETVLKSPLLKDEIDTERLSKKTQVNYEVPNVDVAIVGIQKAATSSLKHYIGEHPDMVTHDRLEFTFFVNDKEYEQGYEEWYRNDFDTAIGADKRVLIKNVGIIFWEEAMVRLSKHNPDVKVILLLRNPVDRAYSAYWYGRNKAVETLPTFEEALAASPTRFKRKADISITSYYEQGHYYELIKRMEKYFPKENIKIVFQEDLQSEPAALMLDVYQFLKLDTSYTPDVSKRYNESASAKLGIVNKIFNADDSILKKGMQLVPYQIRNQLKKKIKVFNQKKFTQPVMNTETRNKLIAYYKPHNKKLGDYISRDLSFWDK